MALGVKSKTDITKVVMMINKYGPIDASRCVQERYNCALVHSSVKSPSSQAQYASSPNVPIVMAFGIRNVSHAHNVKTFWLT
jgi:hypothetical protein